MNTELIPRHVIAKELNITYLRKIEKIIRIYNLSPIEIDSHGIQYFNRSDFVYLKKKQTELYNYFNENYFTYDECIKRGMNSFHIAAITSRDLPELIRINKFYTKRFVYEKVSAQQISNKLARREQLLNTIQVSKLLGISYNNINKLLKEWRITAKDKSLNKYYDPKDIDYLLKKQAERYKHFTKNYYTSKEIKELGVTYYRDYFNEIKGQKIDSIAKINKLKGLKVVYSRKTIDNFLEKKRMQAKNKPFTKEKIREHKKKKNFSVSSKSTKVRKSLREMIALKLQIALSNKELIEILKEHNISYYHISKDEIDIYDRNELDTLLKIQSEEYSNYLQNYYTSSEVLNMDVYLNSKRLKKVQIPPLIKINKFSKNKFLFEKSTVNEVIKEKNIEFIKTDIVNKYYAEPYTAYNLMLIELKLDFYESATLTEKYWTTYVKNFLYTTKGNKITIKKTIKKFVALTELLISITKEKEIFALSAKELNLLLFNEKMFHGYRESLFTFLNKINDSLPQKIINIELLNNPYAEKRERQKLKTNKEIYTTKEFIDLLNYVSNVNLHKENSLKDITNYFKASKMYKKYDSTWLYVLLHMNNGWRSSDISTFPRVDLSLINIKSLKEYNDNILSIEDAKTLISQVRTKMPFIHSKNQQKRYFFCSEEMEYPLANAILICELRTREFNPDNNYIIDFQNARQELRKSTHDNFFANFANEDFKFTSLKMNRTFITFMTNIIKDQTGRNPLEISKFIRNHSDINTTNIYIDIPKEYLDILSGQLFDTGYFGYTYELLTTVLLNKSGNSDRRDIQITDTIKDIFGDIYKIENFSAYINLIKHESRALGDYLDEQNADEISKKLNLIHLGQLPSKKAYYQCLYGECIFYERDCSKCPFSIPHFHVLSSLGKKINKRISEYKIALNSGLKGEKTKAANQLFSELLLLKQAKDKFGEDIINEFNDIKYNDLLLEIQSLDDPYQYISITKKD